MKFLAFTNKKLYILAQMSGPKFELGMTLFSPPVLMYSRLLCIASCLSVLVYGGRVMHHFNDK